MENNIKHISLHSMRECHHTLSKMIIHTPVVRLVSPCIDTLLDGAKVFLKLECLQHTGTFKARGALSVIQKIPPNQRTHGITAASAGNHAIAAAWAAAIEGLSAKIVIQSSANPYRLALAHAYGAKIIVKDGGPATFAEAQRLAIEENRSFIHPFEGIHTTLGTAGIALELLQSLPDLDAIIASVGGGGLLSGIAAATKAINPACQVYGVEPKGANTMHQSLVAGKPITLPQVHTIADSLAPPMTLPFSFGVCQAYVDDVVTVTDDAICAGMVVLQEEAKLAVEPAAGAAMAAMLSVLRNKIKGKRVGLVICGANIGTIDYCQLLTRGVDCVAQLTGD